MTQPSRAQTRRLTAAQVAKLRATPLSFHDYKPTCSWWFKDPNSCSCGGYGTVSLRLLRKLCDSHEALRLARACRPQRRGGKS